ncbi:M23 family metallopeptidase [Candidatus Dojkabacteria bacterium]|nr:M23 family metallopeptidase [Candidatus Dojkabacteria bacterium]
MPPKRQQNPYDTVFDFFFASKPQKKGGKKPTGPGVNIPNLSGAAGAFAEMAGNLTLYPVNMIMGNINQQFQNLGGIIDWRYELGSLGQEDMYGLVSGEKGEEGAYGEVGATKTRTVRVRLGDLSSFIANPNKYIDAAFKKYRTEQNWARFGAITRSMSAAQLGLYAKWSGLDSATAGQVSSIVSGGANIISDSVIKDPKVKRAAYNAAVDYSRGRFDIDEAHLRAAANASEADIGWKKDKKLQVFTDELVSHGYSSRTASVMAQKFWGSRLDSDDLGFMGKTVQQSAKRVLLDKLRRAAAEARLAGDNRTYQRIRNVSRAIASLNNSWGFGRKGVPANLGQIVGRLGFLGRYFKDNFAGGEIIMHALTGDLFGGPVSDLYGISYSKQLGFTDGSADPTKASSVWFGRDTGQGKLLHGLYYWHPANVVKGFLWDGRHWKRWSIDKITGKIRKDLLAWQIYQRMPGVVMQGFIEKFRTRITDRAKALIVKGIQKGYEAIFKGSLEVIVKTSVREALVGFVTQAISQIIGSTVPGIGNIAAILVDLALMVVNFLGEKLLKLLFKIVAIVVLGLLALLLLGVAGVAEFFGGSHGGTDFIHRTYNYPISGSVSDYEQIGEVDPDLWSDVVIPDDYSGSCPLPGSMLRCTQGHDGDDSIYHQQTLAVDFGVVAGTPVVAPHDGVILLANSVNICGDGSGTSYGGWIVLREINADGSPGFTWNFIHVHPAVSVGQYVNAGDLLGTIDGPATATWNECWTNPHLHTHVEDQSGKFVDAEALLRAIGCNFGECL